MRRLQVTTAEEEEGEGMKYPGGGVEFIYFAGDRAKGGVTDE